MVMKKLVIDYSKLSREQRWDIDYHLPPVELREFNEEILIEVGKCVDIVKEKRNPTTTPEEKFMYIDIASIDVVTGMIVNPQELLGEDAPSRARKVVRKGDIIISTCRPTRGAIAIVPKELDNQICSTGFSVIRAKECVNNQYLHFILRSESTREQFRKWSTGSSYPAILDDDVLKTKIPFPNKEVQDRIAQVISEKTRIRNEKIENANKEWEEEIDSIIKQIKQNKYSL